MQALLADPRGDMAQEDVLAALEMDSRTPKIRHGVDILDSDDVPTGETLDFDDAAVSWSYRPPDRVTGAGTSVADVRRTATLSVVGTPDFDLGLRRYRLWTEWMAADLSWVRFHLGVFTPTNPGAQDDGLVIRRRLNLADKTYRYANTFLEDTLRVPATTNAVDYVIADLGTRFGEATTSIPLSTVTLTEDMIFDSGDSMLEVYNSLLQVAGHDDLSTDENGRPFSIPLETIANRGSEWSYGPGEGKIITAGQVDPLLPTLPNVVRFIARQGPTLPVEGNGIKTITNQSTGPASVDERGEEVVLRVEVDAENQTELDAIAAADSQRYFAGGGLRFRGEVALNPLHGDRDVVTLTKPRLDLDGLWIVTEWEYPMKMIDSEGSVLMPLTCERRVTVS